jgi:hypothetical protein
MFSRIHAGLGIDAGVRGSCRVGLLCACLFSASALAQAQYPQGTIGSITGDDLSVERSSGVLSPDSRSVLLINGSVITVHSGQARLGLVGGGSIGICGPAKFTLLESQGALTVALAFGRLHIYLQNEVPFAIYTPLTVARPIALSNGLRDATLGLDPSGALCVLATRGGVRLENQLSGETVVVPEPSEIFLSGGQPNAPAAAGSCRCEVSRSESPRPTPAVEAVSPVVPSQPAPTNQPTPTKSSTASVAVGVANSLPAPKKPASPSIELRAPAPATGTPPPVLVIAGNPSSPPPPSSDEERAATEISLLAAANEARPSAPAPKEASSPAPPVEEPVWTAVMPPLSFDVGSPMPPPGPSPQAILLIREVHVEPDWVFQGHVEDRTAVKSASSVRDIGAQSPEKKKRGFFGWLRRVFGGRSPGPASAPGA